MKPVMKSKSRSITPDTSKFKRNGASGLSASAQTMIDGIAMQTRSLDTTNEQPGSSDSVIVIDSSEDDDDEPLMTSRTLSAA